MESDEPSPLSVYGRTKLEGEREVRDGWVVRSPWLFGATRKFSADDARPGRRQASVGRRRPAWVADFVGHLAEATKAVLDLPYGTYHLAADGEATWAEFAEAIFDEAGIECRCAASRRPSSRGTPSALPFRPAQRAGSADFPRATASAPHSRGSRVANEPPGAWHRTWLRK